MERCAEPSTILAASRTVSALSMRSSVPSEAFSAVLGLKGGQNYGEYSAQGPNLATGAEGRAEALLPQTHSI